jgi:ubiquinol-cytochrome c reductase cytochrome c subunit
MSALRGRILAVIGVLAASGAVIGFAAHGAGAQAPPAPNSVSTPPAPGGLVATGRALFGQGCSSCHGMNAQGVRGVAPSLHGVGELAADFYLRTGRMPLAGPGQEPRRAQPAYTEGQIRALVAYVGSFGGPRIPVVHPERGDLAEGMRIFSTSCQGCHQIVGRGGIVTGAYVPNLEQSTPRQVAQAMAIGPYVMPQFRGQYSQHQIDSIARYVLYTHHPDNAGGWALGNIGPIPEGMVTWFLAIVALLIAMRLIGERTTR